MRNTIKIKEIQKNVYLLNELHKATAYLVVGKEKACLIDTMMGWSNLNEVVKKLTNKPIMVVNTHGHFDHIYGNVYFDKAYMNLKDLELAKEYIEDKRFADTCKKRKLKMPPFEDIKEGDTINLGEISLEIYEVEGHTKGSILLLCPEKRILFTGDTITHQLWLQFKRSMSVKKYISELERVMFLEEKADIILHGHSEDYDDISLMRAILNGAKELVKGKNERDTPYKWFGGVDMQHPFEVESDKHFQQKEHIICYRKDNIN